MALNLRKIAGRKDEAAGGEAPSVRAAGARAESVRRAAVRVEGRWRPAAPPPGSPYGDFLEWASAGGIPSEEEIDLAVDAWMEGGTAGPSPR